MKKMKIEKPSLRKAKQKAWRQFSLYIRTKDSIDGVNQCYTCMNVFEIKRLQAGHGLGGRNNAVLFMEDIVRPQCVGCNMYARGRYPVFTRRLITELGLDQYDEIVKQSNKIIKYTIQDYEDIYDKYTKKLNEIKD